VAEVIPNPDLDRKFSVRLDSRRRPTLPVELLEVLGVGAGDVLIASISAEHAVILETPDHVRARLRRAFGAPEEGHGVDDSV
jgi:bifunctional DNA-binding transcriptional regulator/antitoxin component of YhaV-PrlF toxin-antitoxin module